MTTEIVPVIFRKEYHEGTRKSWDIVAILPTELATQSPYYLSAYGSVSEGWTFPEGYTWMSTSYDWYFSKTAPAKPEEYAPLLDYLKTLEGYKNLKVYRKMQSWFLEARKEKLARIRNS